MARPQRQYTLRDYFTVEAMSEIKHEFYRGEIFAMAGASAAHNEITANVLARLRRQGCRAYGSDFRVQTPTGLLTYPDVSVFCGALALVRGRDDTATNPLLLIEVLSDATRDYDRGEKFSAYKSIPTLREYVLIEQTTVRIEQWARGARGRWTLSVHERRDGSVRLGSVPVVLTIAEVYREVFAGHGTSTRAQAPR